MYLYVANSELSAFTFIGMPSTVTSKVTNGFAPWGSIADGTSIVFDKLTTADSKQLLFTLSSSCSSASTCLIAIWNTVMKGSKTPLYFRNDARIVAITYRVNFNTDVGGAYHTLQIDSGSFSSSASLAIVETKLYCRDSTMFQEDAYSLNMASSMTGGLELFASTFEGDGIVATWSNAMDYFHAFNNVIPQSSYTGSDTALNAPSASRACNTCTDSLCSNVGGVPIKNVNELSRGSPKYVKRCVMSSSYKRASYDEWVNAAAPGSCIVLPDTAAKIAAAAAARPPLSSVAVIVNGTTHTHAQAVSGDAATAVSALTCGARLDRLASLRSLFAYPATSAACGGVPPASFAPSLTFDTSFTDPRGVTKRVCAIGSPSRRAGFQPSDATRPYSTATTTASGGGRGRAGSREGLGPSLRW